MRWWIAGGVPRKVNANAIGALCKIQAGRADALSQAQKQVIVSNRENLTKNCYLNYNGNIVAHLLAPQCNPKLNSTAMALMHEDLTKEAYKKDCNNLMKN